MGTFLRYLPNGVLQAAGTSPSYSWQAVLSLESLQSLALCPFKIHNLTDTIMSGRI